MIPESFEYHTPKNLAEATRLVNQFGAEGKLLAGGHSLVPLMKLRLAAPKHLIDITGIGELNYIREEGDRFEIGALTTHFQLESSDLLKSRCPLLPETAREIGDVQVRNKGTLGGSLAHSDPAADWPAAAVALDAEMHAVSASGERWIPARDFFVDLLATALQPEEILTAIRVPAMPARGGDAYAKLRHPASGFAVVGVAAGGEERVNAVLVPAPGVSPDAVDRIVQQSDGALSRSTVEAKKRMRLRQCRQLLDVLKVRWNGAFGCERVKALLRILKRRDRLGRAGH